jgi:hypothetical protein
MSSLLFNGNATSYLRIPNTDDFDFGTDNFTIEWYQYQTDNNFFSRIFQVGATIELTNNIGISIERYPTGSTAGTAAEIYYWRPYPISPIKIATIQRTEYINKWVHFAISRSSGTTKIFMNGVSIGSIPDTSNYNGSRDLVIGNESIPVNASAFGGYITYFTWLKGKALYTANFTVSNTYPPFNRKLYIIFKSRQFCWFIRKYSNQ